MTQNPHPIITPNADQWAAYVRQHPRGHFLQLSAWGDLKAAYGWDVRRVGVQGTQGELVGGAQLLFRSLPMGLGKMAYLTMGPLVNDENVMAVLWPAIDDTAKGANARFIKWEPGIFHNVEDQPDMSSWHFRPAPQSIQPPRTVLIDISGTDDEILGRMNQGTRRKIRQSLKNDVRYLQAKREDMVKFNRLMQTTGQRNEFGVHEAAYYDLMYDLFVPQGDAAVFLAMHEEDALAAIFVFALGEHAWYLSGASSNDKRTLMASYGIQWQAIQWARQRGCHYYDMWGIPDEDEHTLEAQFQERSDDLWGVYGFKRGWGGSVIRSMGAWDKAYNPLVYKAYETYLRLRG